MIRASTLVLAVLLVSTAARAEQGVDVPLDAPASHSFEPGMIGLPSEVVDDFSPSAQTVAASPRLDGSAGQTVVTFRFPERLWFPQFTTIALDCLWSASSDECGAADGFASSGRLLPSQSALGFVTTFRTCHAPEDRAVQLTADSRWSAATDSRPSR